jgi:hypothetical protein
MGMPQDLQHGGGIQGPRPDGKAQRPSEQVWPPLYDPKKLGHSGLHSGLCTIETSVLHHGNM